jgi:hypothetical protein
LELNTAKYLLLNGFYVGILVSKNHIMNFILYNLIR